MIKSEKHLKGFLKKDFKSLRKIISEIDQYYYIKEEIKTYKDGTPKLDKNGNTKKRILYPSTGELKSIQSKIKNILVKIPLPENIYGVKGKGKGSIENAKAHKGKKYKFETDLKDFFPSIKPFLVYQAFIRHGFSADVATLFTKLTTYKNQVPQGVPSSSSIINLVFLPIHNKLTEYCNSNKITYTRLVDDLTFSSSFDFKESLPKLIEIITENSFSINHRKTKYAKGAIIVTGAWVRNNVLDPTDIQKEKFNNANLSHAQEQGLKNYFKRVKSA